MRTIPVLILILILSLARPLFADPRVIGNDAPAQPPRTLRLEPIWRIGGESYMFGLMIEAITDADGNVYLLDQQLNHATVVSPDGEILREIGREGEGPGEVRTPQDIVMMPDGTVAFAQQFPGKFIKLGLHGTPAGNVTLGGPGTESGGFTVIATCSHRDDRLLVGALLQAPVQNGQSRQSYLALVSGDGRELVRYCEHNTVLDFRTPHFVESEMLACFLGSYAQGPGGRVYAARERDAYAIQVFDADGGLEMLIERTFESRRRDRRELDRMNELFEVQDRNLPLSITWEVEPSDQVLGELHVDDAGNLWVMHNKSAHGQPEGIFLAYDVFAPDGRWLHEARIAADADPAHDGLIFLDGDRVLLVKGLVLARLTASGSQGAVFDEDGEAAEITVICGRLADADPVDGP